MYLISVGACMSVSVFEMCSFIMYLFHVEFECRTTIFSTINYMHDPIIFGRYCSRDQGQDFC